MAVQLALGVQPVRKRITEGARAPPEEFVRSCSNAVVRRPRARIGNKAGSVRPRINPCLSSRDRRTDVPHGWDFSARRGCCREKSVRHVNLLWMDKMRRRPRRLYSREALISGALRMPPGP